MNDDPNPFIPQAHKGAQRQQPRFRAITALAWLVVGAVLARGAYLQIMNGAQYRARAEHNRVEQHIEPAARGLIYDRDGTQLVENISSTDVVIDPATLPPPGEEQSVMTTLADILPNTDYSTIEDAVSRARNRKRLVVLRRAIEHTTVLDIEERQTELPGVRLVSSLVRDYKRPHAFAHVIGYTNLVTQEELDANEQLHPTDATGKQGVENVYDEALRGQNGVSYVEVNAAGEPQTQVGKREAKPGQDLKLTIDADLQQLIFDTFAERVKELREGATTEQQSEDVRGAVVALDPNSGEILALVSFPSFDPNAFSQPAANRKTASVFENKDQPLFNRAADGTYPSGSTIKPFIAAAALEEGIISDDTTILSTGGISIGPWSFADWKAGGHGVTDVTKAIAESVNTFFYAITGGHKEQEGLGVYKTTQYLREFGWAQKTGIGLTSESAGFLPSPEWKQAKKGESWYVGDTYNLGIGQGNVLVTPLQLARATAAIANNGMLYTPKLVSSNERAQRVDVSSDALSIVRDGMREAVTDGSARALANLPIAIAGKTGTAQIGGSEETHAWFTSFAPYNDPELVVTVLLERGGAGDKQAVPFARDIWNWWASQNTSAE